MRKRKNEREKKDERKEREAMLSGEKNRGGKD